MEPSQNLPALRALLGAAGIERAEVVAQAGTHAIPTPESWWSAVLGTGYRSTLERLDADARERLRAAHFEFVERMGTRDVEANVVFAIATKA